jgi:hypothetical protein
VLRLREKVLGEVPAHDLRIESDLLEEDEDPASIRLGHMLEPMLVGLAAQKHELLVRPGETARSSVHPWLGATPDAVEVAPPTLPVLARQRKRVIAKQPARAAVEAKVVGRHRFAHWGEGVHDVAPYVGVQAQTQMTVLGVKVCFVSALFGTEHRTYVLEHSSLLEEMILEMGHKFWHEHVLPQRMPAPDGTDDAWKMIREKYPKPRVADLVVATSAWDEKAREALDMAEQRKHCEREEKRLKQELAIMIGDWPGVKGDGWRALFQEQAGYHVPAHDVDAHRVLDLRAVKTEAEKEAANAARKGRAA